MSINPCMLRHVHGSPEGLPCFSPYSGTTYPTIKNSMKTTIESLRRLWLVFIVCLFIL